VEGKRGLQRSPQKPGGAGDEKLRRRIKREKRPRRKRQGNKASRRGKGGHKRKQVQSEEEH